MNLPAAELPQPCDLPSLCKAVGDSLRLDILRVLGKDSLGVLELSEAFAIKQSLMSHHLKILSQVGLIQSRREGNSIFYRRAWLTPTDNWLSFKQGLYACLESVPMPEDFKQRLSGIYAERAKASAAFFKDNADKFREQQDLIANINVYAASVEGLISSAPGFTCALEVGPGEGEFLAVLQQHFEQVIALDNSPEMLAKAQALTVEMGLQRINFLLGSTELLIAAKQKVDCIVVNMVLHHLASPAQMFQELSQLLVPGGLLIISELCRHDQSWTQQACGDLWQGFEADDLTGWANSAGLTPGQSSYLALRNGFQIQVHQFFKPMGM
jgi:2-polyprenyl-3-methyl-5-hydroxy-6-metoxy-1,4-benzoquinol methylase/DNA-binding transcriptional ArsR family regulator